MKISAKICLSVLASSLLLVMSAPSFADRGENHGVSHGAPVAGGTTLAASLTGASGAGTGSFSYSWNTATNSGRIHASVHIPVDGTIITNANVASLPVTLVVNGTTTYTLQISDLDFTYSSATVATSSAEFAVSATETNSAYSTTLGSTTATSLPVLALGETVAIYLNGSSTPTLTGTLSAPNTTRGYRD